VFGLVVAALAIASFLFVLTTLRRSQPEGRVSLTTGVRYTVKIGEVSSAHRQAAEAMLTHPGLVAVARGHELFLQEMRGGKIALCAGSFESGDCIEARQLLSGLRSYTEGGRRAFASAVIWMYTPSKTQ